MSGNNESKTQQTEETTANQPTVDDKIQKMQELLKNYPIKIGIGVLQPVSETNRFLTMSRSDMRRMDAEECGEAAVVLNQAATFIQLETNRVQADIHWCEDYIDFLIASNISNCGSQYTPFEYRKKLAIKQNDVASRLYAIVVQAKLRLDAIAYLPNQLRATSASFSELQQTKRSQR